MAGKSLIPSLGRKRYEDPWSWLAMQFRWTELVSFRFSDVLSQNIRVIEEDTQKTPVRHLLLDYTHTHTHDCISHTHTCLHTDLHIHMYTCTIAHTHTHTVPITTYLCETMKTNPWEIFKRNKKVDMTGMPWWWAGWYQTMCIRQLSTGPV